MKNLLRFISKIYELLVRLRNKLYDKGWFKIHRLDRPVISVGNLTLGGTGKTPTVITLAKILQQSGYSVSVLLRGYKGQYGDGPLLVSDGSQLRPEAARAGDEALVIAKNLPSALVTVAKNRGLAGKWIESWSSVDVHLLDDGFQHRKLDRCLNLVLIDVTNPFGGESIVPSGQLREPIEALSRADAVILTRTHPGNSYQSLISRVQHLKPGIPCFLAMQVLQSASDRTAQGELAAVPLAGCRALAFAGLANPKQFFNSLRDSQVELVETLYFPDHHRYTSRDLTAIRDRCRDLQIKTVITTEKDIENFLVSSLAPLRVLTAKVTFEFKGNGLQRLLAQVMAEVTQ